MTGFTRSFVRKFLVEFVVVLRVLRRARREGATVLLLSVFPNVLAAILSWRGFFRGVDLHVVLHSEVESLVMPGKQAIHRLGFWTNLALLRLFRGDSPRLYVLGEGIRRRLVARFPQHPQLRSLRVLDHPYVFAPPEAVGPRRTAQALRIGFVGSGRAIKGINEFFRLANAFEPEWRSGLLEFVLIGGAIRSELVENSDVVTVLADQPVGLGDERYRQEIRQLDCALFLYQQDYSFTASGAVFDVIDAGVEILSLRNSYLQDLARDDVEGGLRFLPDSGAIAAEIRSRLERVGEPRRFSYARIKQRHSAEVERELLAMIAGEPVGQEEMAR